MSTPILPNIGDFNWGGVLNSAVTSVSTTSNQNATSIASHAAGSDPHGDRAWSQALFNSKFGSVTTVSTTQPSTANINDVWINPSTSTGGVSVYTSSGWVTVAASTATLQTQINSVQTTTNNNSSSITTLQGNVTSLQSQITANSFKLSGYGSFYWDGSITPTGTITPFSFSSSPVAVGCSLVSGAVTINTAGTWAFAGSARCTGTNGVSVAANLGLSALSNFGATHAADASAYLLTVSGLGAFSAGAVENLTYWASNNASSARFTHANLMCWRVGP